MNRKNSCVAGLLLLGAVSGTGRRLAQAQTNSPQAKLSVHWEELTGPDFLEAIKRSQGTCLLPFGILEKHGPHMPIGSDLLNARYAALHAAEHNMPWSSQSIILAKSPRPVTSPAPSPTTAICSWHCFRQPRTRWLATGCKKILVVNGHGGNSSLLPYFAQSQLDKPHDYVVYLFDQRTPATEEAPKRKPPSTRTPVKAKPQRMMIVRPDLLHQDRATSESGADQHRLNLPEGVYTGIWWYARFPDHYAGEGSAATRELGEYQMKWWVDSVSKVIVAIKPTTSASNCKTNSTKKRTPLGPRRSSGNFLRRSGDPAPAAGKIEGVVNSQILLQKL